MLVIICGMPILCFYSNVLWRRAKALQATVLRVPSVSSSRQDKVFQTLRRCFFPSLGVTGKRNSIENGNTLMLATKKSYLLRHFRKKRAFPIWCYSTKTNPSHFSELQCVVVGGFFAVAGSGGGGVGGCSSVQRPC